MAGTDARVTHVAWFCTEIKTTGRDSEHARAVGAGLTHAASCGSSAMNAGLQDQSPPRRRPRFGNITAAEVESSSGTTATPVAAAMRRGAPPHSRINIALETDIGHDCDDLQALIVALKDHINGAVRIVYIATVSQANVQRAHLVQWLCGRMGVSDVPIVPSKREMACVGTKALNNCVDVWQFALNEVSGSSRSLTSNHPMHACATISRPRQRLSALCSRVISEQRDGRQAGWLLDV